MKTTSFPIVCVGGSAGGLEAFQNLLEDLSSKTGMAFVFIMHLSPEHRSILSELLAKKTKMPVVEARNGMRVEADHIYVIPPKTNMTLSKGKLVVKSVRNARLRHLPIDRFFKSLSEELGSRAIGVILSGTATDGTLGAEAIKAGGGITFAQDKKSAKYDGMPQSAVSAGCVDFVMPPKKIAKELSLIAKHPLISPAVRVKEKKPATTERKGFEGVLQTLRIVKGFDFTDYKPATMNRLISNKMDLLKLSRLKDYIKRLNADEKEVERLYDALLINVTSFFRDPNAFEALKKTALSAILKDKPMGQCVRVWVSGCSTGEEACSIGICILELLGEKAGTVPVQIFATDANERIIEKARRGVYSKTIKNAVSPERLKRFFIEDGDSYRISKQLRDMCVFSRQNIFGDPPLSNMDLISCRNLLIYLQPVLQEKVFRNVHYGLRPGGFLFLGNSESIGSYSNLFRPLNRKQGLFVKKSFSFGLRPEETPRYYMPGRSGTDAKTYPKDTEENDIERLIDNIVLSEYAPCGVLIDGDMHVLSFRGSTGRYLEPAAGKPSFDLFRLAREGLSLPLRSVIHKARETRRPAKREAESVKYNGGRFGVNITVIPVRAKNLKEELYLVLFDRSVSPAAPHYQPKKRTAVGKVKDERYLLSLQKEIDETKEYLHTVIEEQENVSEEVKTANEEILTSNEELQSTNEELETSKEELQSTNEELNTTNEELQNRNAEVSILNNDLVNLLGSINIPIIMLDADFVIRRTTPHVEKVLNIVPSDIGRPINKIRLGLDIPNLEKTLLDVTKSLHPKTLEIKDDDESWYSVTVRPYRTTDNKIDGLVIIFIDITAAKKAETLAKRSAAAMATVTAERKRADEFDSAYKELRETKDMLVQSEKLAAIGELSAGVAHELNSPLTGILGIIRSRIRHTSPDSIEHEDLKKVEAAGEYMARIIKNLTEFATPSAAKVEKLVCNDIIDSVLDFSKKIISDKGITLQKELEENLPAIKCDKTLAQQVIVTLMNNAIDSMEENGLLKISTGSVLENEERFVEIEFQDNGCGIPEENLTRIFEPFFTTKRPGKGVGLGLSIAHSIIMNHKGKILVESKVGKGTTFRVRMPATVNI